MRRVLLAIALLLPACSGELAEVSPFVQPDLTGSVSIPLSSTVADGTTYLLRAATVEIGGAAMLTLSTPHAADASRSLRDRGAAQHALSSPLPPGSYTLYLQPGYQLIEVDPSGHERVLDAALASHNPLHFTVRELEDATLKLSFAHDGHKVVFGQREAVRVTSVY
jgi:hypothetical protein